MHHQTAQGSGGALSEENVDEFPGAGLGVEKPGVHHHLFHARGQSFRAGVEDVVERRHAPDRARVRFEFHPGQFNPVMAVGPHRYGVAVAHLGEKPAESICGTEPPDLGSQGGVHVIADRHDLPVPEKRYVLGNCRVEAAVVFLGAGDAPEGRELSIAVFFESEDRVGPGQLATHDRHLFLPGIGDEVHVVEIPGVVLDSDPRRSAFGRSLPFEPGAELVRGLTGALNVALQLGAGARHPCGQRAQVRALPVHGPDSHHPEISGVLDQVAFGLLKQWRDSSDPCAEFGGGVRREGVLVGLEIYPAVDDRAFVGR